MNFKVSTSETWFPELERVLNSEKDEYFFPENTGASGAPREPWINTARLGWRILYQTGFAGLPGLPATTGGPRGLCTSLCRPLPLLALTPLPRQDMGYHGHRNHRTRCKATSFPFLPSPPPFCRMHSYNSRYKIKKQWWPRMGPFFFWKKKKKSNNLFLNSVSKFTFA